MNYGISLSRQRGRGVVGTIVLALVLGAGLIFAMYWFSRRPAVDAPPAAVTAAPADAAPVVVATPEGDPGELAGLAMQQKRMFVPAGNNAFELYLKVLETDAENVQARNALIELFPYAVLYVEQRIAAGDAADGERVLALMQRADPNAPALRRLTSALADVRTRATAAQAEADRRAAALQAAGTPVPATPTASVPAPVAAAPAPVTTAPPPSSTPAASTQPAPVAAVPPPAATEPAPVAAAPVSRPAASSSGVPAVVSSAQPRYPVMAMRRKLEGRVELTYTVQPNGTVSNVSVVSSTPPGIFDREAVAAMEKWRFAPAATTSQGRRAFDFKLD